MSGESRIYVVGGASRGLGRAVAAELVKSGARVLCVARDEESLTKTVAELGGSASSLVADLAEPSAAEAITAAVDREGAELSGMLVNAGGPPPGNALDLSDGDWEDAFRLLIGGPVRILRALQTRLVDGASILFVTSSSVRQPIRGLDSSNVLRPGVAALTKVLAQELGPSVRVNSIAPGRFDTDRVRSLDAGRANAAGITLEKQVERTSAAIPLGRYGDPSELARVAAFLLSDAASYVNGASIQVDGGLTSAVP